MFLVITHSPIDDTWEDRDKVLYETVGSKSSKSLAGVEVREHQWLVKTFGDAKALQKALSRIDKVKVTIRLKGRERENPERAHILLGKVTTQVKEAKFARIEGPITGGIFESAK